MDFKMQKLKDAIMDIANDSGLMPISKEQKCTKTQAVVLASACAVAGIAIGFGTKCLLEKIKEKSEYEKSAFALDPETDFDEDFNYDYDGIDDMDDIDLNDIVEDDDDDTQMDVVEDKE